MNHDKFLKLAQHIATWSKDPSTQVGCILVNDKRIVVGMGFNGFPRGVDDCPARYKDRETKYRFVQHAETNAIFNSTEKLDGCTAYITHQPCCNCAGALIQAGIKYVYTVVPEPGLAERFNDSFKAAEDMFKEAGVSLVFHEPIVDSTVIKPKSCDIVFDYFSPHNGEYHYKCNTCGATDWFARYTTVDKNKPIKGCKK